MTFTKSCRSAMLTRPIMPKSIKTRILPFSRKIFPGCGSAWKKPYSKIWLSIEFTPTSARNFRSYRAAFSGSASTVVTESP